MRGAGQRDNGCCEALKRLNPPVPVPHLCAEPQGLVHAAAELCGDPEGGVGHFHLADIVSRVDEKGSYVGKGYQQEVSGSQLHPSQPSIFIICLVPVSTFLPATA